MKNKQFQVNKLNAKGDELTKGLATVFDEFEASVDKNFLLEAGTKNWAHDYMLTHLAIAFQFACQAMSARPDVKA